MPEQDPGLEHSRNIVRGARLRLERLRRWAPGEEGSLRYGGPRAWRLLRRTLERAYRAIESLRLAAWPADSATRPEWERRRRELEARSLRTESAQRELEARQKGLDAEWDRVFSELESVHEGWAALQSELPPSERDADALGLLQERLARLEVLWGELLQEEAHLVRERGLVDRLWRWLVGVWVPSVERSLPEGEHRQAWAPLRRRMVDLDRRWRGSLSELKRSLVEEEAATWRARLEEAESRAEALSRELLAARAGRPGTEGAAEELMTLQRMLEGSRADFEAARLEKADLRAQLNRLTERLQGCERSLESSRKKQLDAEARSRAAERQLAQTSAREESLTRENEALRRLVESDHEALRRQGSKEEGLSTRLKAALDARRKALLGRRSAEEELEREKEKLKDRLAAVRDAWDGRVRELKERALAAEERVLKERTLFEREKAALAASARDLQAERDEWRRRLEKSIAEFVAGKPVADDLVRRGYEEKLRAHEEALENARLALSAERELRRRFGAEAAVLRRELEAMREVLSQAEREISELRNKQPD